MPRKPQKPLGETLADVDDRLTALETQPRLGASSLDNETLTIKDENERVKGAVGRQPDGSHGSRVVESPPQPTPSHPSLKAGEAGVVSVRWDGNTESGEPVPLIHGHVEVVGMAPSASTYEAMGTIRDRDGGTTSVVCDEAGLWTFRLVLVGQDRKTRSARSVGVSIDVVMPVDGDAIQADIDQAKQDLADAEAEWEQSKTDLQAGLDQINNETIPQVRTDAQQWADDAEAAAVSQAAQDAQAEYDRLQELAERALRRTSNLIYDGSFETDWYQQAWSSDELEVSTVEHGSVDATDGVQIARIDTGGGVTHGSLNFTPESYAGDAPTNNFRDLSMPVEPGQVWRFTMDARATNSSFSGTMRIRCNIADSVNTVEQLEFTPTLDWQTYTLDVTIPQGVTSVYWMWRPSVADGGFFADRVSARDITDIKAALDKAEAAEQAAQDAHAAAGDAWDHADTAMTRAGQVGSRMGGETTPTGTAPENSLWFQWSDMDDPNRTVLGVWQMIDGNWTEQDSSDPALIPTVDIGAATVGTLKAVRIDVASLFVDTQFVNNLHAETVEAMRVTAETGFIGGVLLENGAVTTEKLTVTSDMTAAIAEFLEVKAVHIDFNSMVGSSAFIAEMETSNVKLASEVTNRRFEVSGEGWQLTDTTTGEVLASVGVDGGAVFRGRLEAGGTAGQGAIADVGSFPYYSAITGGNTHAQGVPYLRLSDGTTADDDQPGLVNDGRTLILASGVDDPSTGSRRDVVIDAHTRVPTLAVSSSVETRDLLLSDSTLGSAYLAPTKLDFYDSSTSRRWGFERRGTDNLQSQVLGEMAHFQGADDMIIRSRTSQHSLSAGNRLRGSVTFGTPARTGSRWPHTSGLVASGAGGYGDHRSVVVTAEGSSASGFGWTAVAPSENSGVVNFYVMALSIWGGE